MVGCVCVERAPGGDTHPAGSQLPSPVPLSCFLWLKEAPEMRWLAAPEIRWRSSLCVNFISVTLRTVTKYTSWVPSLEILLSQVYTFLDVYKGDADVSVA